MLTRRSLLAGAGAGLAAACARGARPRPPTGDPADLSATEGLGRLDAGTLTAEAWAVALLDRAAARRALNAFITLDREQVLADARAADRAPRRGPLHGLPVAIKDVIDTAGIRTTYATAALRDHVPAADAAIVARLRAAGAIVLGKTNCDELSLGSASQDSAFGGVHNPRDPDRIPGGSSGGSAAAVAAGLAPLAIGADTTGSIRMPAALCGTVGFRPTTGRYPTTGVWPISPTLDALGPIARTVDDCALVDGVLAGDAAPLPATRVRGLRVGVPRRHFVEPIDDAGVLAAFERAVAELRAAGAVVVEADLPDTPLLAPFACAYPILLAEASAAMAAFMVANAIPMTLTEVHAGLTPGVRALFDQFVLAEPPPFDLAAALRDRDTLIALFEGYRDQHRLDVTAVPTVPFVAPRIGQATVRYGHGDAGWFDVIESSTAVGSVVARPGVSLPIGEADGLPVGLLLEASPGDDRALLAAARAVEGALGSRGPS
jgi:mandelamide amidase